MAVSRLRPLLDHIMTPCNMFRTVLVQSIMDVTTLSLKPFLFGFGHFTGISSALSSSRIMSAGGSPMPYSVGRYTKYFYSDLAGPKLPFRP